MPASTTVPLSVAPGAAPGAAEAAVNRRKRQAAQARRNLVEYYVRRASTPGGAVVAGIALLLMGESIGGALVATVCGIALGWVVKTVMLIVGMGFSAVEAGYGYVFGETPEEKASGPSLRYVVYGWLFDMLPPVLAAAWTLAVGAVV